MEKLAGAAAAAAGEDESGVANAVRAAHLAKADLVSQAVVEFTNQQGVMGGYYAAASAGEAPEVCAAPSSTIVRASQVTIFPPAFAASASLSPTSSTPAVASSPSTSPRPTGSSDPYAVRRAAIGIIAMLRTMPTVGLKTSSPRRLTLTLSRALNSIAPLWLKRSSSSSQGA